MPIASAKELPISRMRRAEVFIGTLRVEASLKPRLLVTSR